MGRRTTVWGILSASCASSASVVCKPCRSCRRLLGGLVSSGFHRICRRNGSGKRRGDGILHGTIPQHHTTPHARELSSLSLSLPFWEPSHYDLPRHLTTCHSRTTRNLRTRACMLLLSAPRTLVASVAKGALTAGSALEWELEAATLHQNVTLNRSGQSDSSLDSALSLLLFASWWHLLSSALI